MVTRMRQQVVIFGSRGDAGEIRINRADEGDVRVVFSVTEDDGTYHPGVVGLEPDEARRFAEHIISAADIIEGADSSVLRRARELHERHVDLLAGCPLCELEAGHQRDRLSCESCGQPLRPDEPYDGHPECREQE